MFLLKPAQAEKNPTRYLRKANGLGTMRAHYGKKEKNDNLKMSDKPGEP